MERLISAVSSPPPLPARILAAEYVRMSTEHQQYSTENQRVAIREYAARRGMEIARTYEDAGKSGLSIRERYGLQRLIEDVQTGLASFQAILVYDVSRWGRFQDADESAYYEYICRRSKIDVHYCAEQFENDGSPVSTIVKGIKRAMAGEYSRELSAKVFVGQCRLVEMGFNQGSKGGFGLRRVLIDSAGVVKGILKRGERKSITTDRVILRPGPAEEVATVVRIYQMYLHEKKLEAEIARILNAEGILADTGRPWTLATVRGLLTNEKYIGNSVYNRTSFKLKKKRVRNDPEMWVRHTGAFEPVVPMDLFAGVQELMRTRIEPRTDEALLSDLRALFEREHHLTGKLINETEGMACSLVYGGRFHGLTNAYRLVGYTPTQDFRHLANRQGILQVAERLRAEIVEGIRERGGTIEPSGTPGVLVVNQEFTVSIRIAQCRTSSTSYRWGVSIAATADITVLVRMNGGNTGPFDYYLLPKNSIEVRQLKLKEDNGFAIDTFRFPSLEFLLGLGGRTKLTERI